MGDPGTDRPERTRQMHRSDRGRPELLGGSLDRLGAVPVGRRAESTFRWPRLVQRESQPPAALQQWLGLFAGCASPEPVGADESCEDALELFFRFALFQ